MTTIITPYVSGSPISSTSRYPGMIEAGPAAAELRAAGYYVTVTSPGSGLSGAAYAEATKDYAFEVTAREFVVGDGATFTRHTDSVACTVIAKTAKTMTLREDNAKLLNGMGSGAPDALKCSPGGFCGHVEGNQRYEYTADPAGPVRVARLTKRGWEVTGFRISGGRHAHYDLNF